nr:tetratricopeptide repeat protein [uncultured Bacteroides sp.]
MLDSRTQRLIDRYEEMKKKNKNVYLEADALIEIASAYRNDGQDDNALSVLEYGLMLHPGNTDILIEKVYFYIDKNMLPEASSTFNEIADVFSRDVKILKAELCLNEKNIEEANAIFNELEDKEEIDTIFEFANLYLESNYIKEALSLLEPMISEDNSEELISLLAECYNLNEQYDLAIEWFNKLIDLDPYDVSSWIMLSDIYIEIKQYDKALEAADFALAIDPKNQNAKMKKSICYECLGNYEESESFLNEAIISAVIPNELTHSFSGTRFLNMCKWEEAYEEFDKALTTLTSNDDIMHCELYKNLIFCQIKMENYDKANELILKGKSLFPQEADFNLFIGEIYLKKGDEEKAWEQWNFALIKASDISLERNIEARYEIGLKSFNSKKYEWAKHIFEEIKNMDPDFEDINKYLACACLMLKDRDGFYIYNSLVEEPLDILTVYSILGYEKEEDKSEITDEIKTILNDFYEQDEEDQDIK